ncbi:MAG: hypothetical protein K5629_03515 [Eubacteriales bacterium]|nr:hypothetical protein [Eubacteriales bacterium]
MNDISGVFEENYYCETPQGLKYLLSTQIMNQMEIKSLTRERDAVYALTTIEMCVEARAALKEIIIFLLYIYAACTNKFSIGLAAGISILGPGLFQYVFDYLSLYKVPMLPLLLRTIGFAFRLYADKLVMLVLSLFVFHNIWISVCYIGFVFVKYVIGMSSALFIGIKYVDFLRRTEAKHNNEIGFYSLELYDLI